MSNAQEKLMSSILIDSNSNCWEWLKYKDKDGYGTIRFRNKDYKAHRLSYLTFNGEIPQGMLVCHKCDNPKCINPMHLFLGSYSDNVQDMLKKNRQNYLLGEEHQNSKLTVNDVKKIKLMLLNKISHQLISQYFNVCRQSITNIKNEMTWRNVNV